jgi:hypothetical protein
MAAYWLSGGYLDGYFVAAAWFFVIGKQLLPYLKNRKSRFSFP